MIVLRNANCRDFVIFILSGIRSLHKRPYLSTNLQISQFGNKIWLPCLFSQYFFVNITLFLKLSHEYNIIGLHYIFLLFFILIFTLDLIFRFMMLCTIVGNLWLRMTSSALQIDFLQSLCQF